MLLYHYMALCVAITAKPQTRSVRAGHIKARIWLFSYVAFNMNHQKGIKESLNYFFPKLHHVTSKLTSFPLSIQIPEEEGCEKYDFKVIHQIIRELTIGIYVLNQVPSISLEANFDCSTSVQLPPAYIDTKVGNYKSDMAAIYTG